MSELRKGQNWFRGVDTLRFVLAFIVILSHLDNVYAEKLKISSSFVFKAAGVLLANAFDGTAAVIAFFIISGFVIHYPSKTGITSIPQFWARRFTRLLIPFFIITIAGSAFDHPEKDVTWSLFCELIYYAVYPLLSKIRLSWNYKFIIAWLVAAIFIIVFARNDVMAFINQTNNNYQGYYWQFGNYLTWIVGLPCWLLGVLIAEHIDRLQSVMNTTIWFYRISAFAISGFCTFGKFHLHLSYILSMNVLALLLYKWIQAEIGYFKAHKPVVFLENMGKTSYSLYLCHPITFLLLKHIIILNSFTYPLFIVTAVLTAHIFYLAIEKPSHKLAKHFKQKYFAVK